MLNRLKIENFKAWREADLRFGKVTGFFGANSAGKSSLLQLLLLLKQTRNATDRGLVLDFGGPADIVNLGTFKDVVHRHGRAEPHELDSRLDAARDAEDKGSTGAVGRPSLQGEASSNAVRGRSETGAALAARAGISVRR